MDWRSLEAGAGTTDPNGPEDTRPGTQSRFSSSSSRRSHNYLGLFLFLKYPNHMCLFFFLENWEAVSFSWVGQEKNLKEVEKLEQITWAPFFGVEWCRQIFLTGAHPTYRKVEGFREICFVTSQSRKA